MCSYTVREARSATAPDSFNIPANANVAAIAGGVGTADCDDGAFLVIPNSAVTVQYIYLDSRLLSRVFL